MSASKGRTHQLSKYETNIKCKMFQHIRGEDEDLVGGVAFDF